MVPVAKSAGQSGGCRHGQRPGTSGTIFSCKFAWSFWGIRRRCLAEKWPRRKSGFESSRRGGRGNRGQTRRWVSGHMKKKLKMILLSRHMFTYYYRPYTLLRPAKGIRTLALRTWRDRTRQCTPRTQCRTGSGSGWRSRRRGRPTSHWTSRSRASWPHASGRFRPVQLSTTKK